MQTAAIHVIESMNDVVCSLLPLWLKSGRKTEELAMRFHLNLFVSCACLLAPCTALNASEVRVWGDTSVASPGVFAVPASLYNAVAVAAT